MPLSFSKENPLNSEQIIQYLKAERNRLDEAIAVLGGSGKSAREARGGRRHMSTEARRRISEAQKRRWAKRKRVGAASAAGSSVTVIGKRRGGMSAEARKRLSEMMKRRWAARRRKAA